MSEQAIRRARDIRRNRPLDGQSAAERTALWFHRIVIVLGFLMIFFPPFNPGRISDKISGNLTLLTSATSFGTVTTKLSAYMIEGSRYALNKADISLSMLGCAMVLVGILGAGVGACVSLGNRRMRRLGVWLPMGGAALILGGLLVNRTAYGQILRADAVRDYILSAGGSAEEVQTHLADLGLQWPAFAGTAWAVAAVLIFLSSLAVWLVTYSAEREEKCEMPEKYRLFIMFLPVLLLSFVFAYLPIYGWRYAFYNAKAGDELTRDLFVGWANFSTLINDPGTSVKILQVLRNTLVMSGLGIATSWLPIAFAILLDQVPAHRADPDDDPELPLVGAGVRGGPVDLLGGRPDQQPAQPPDRQRLPACGLPGQRGRDLDQDAPLGHLEGPGLERHHLHRGHRRHRPAAV